MIDPSSPGYKEYMKEAKALFDEYDKKMEEFRSPSGFRGLDGDNTADLSRERNRKLKDLQKKYGFI